MWVCICIYADMCVYVCVCTYGCMDACMDGCMDVWMYGYMDIWIYGCMDVCACMYVFMHVRTYVGRYVYILYLYICIYIYTHNECVCVWVSFSSAILSLSPIFWHTHGSLCVTIHWISKNIVLVILKRQVDWFKLAMTGFFQEWTGIIQQKCWYTMANQCNGMKRNSEFNEPMGIYVVTNHQYSLWLGFA